MPEALAPPKAVRRSRRNQLLIQQIPTSTWRAETDPAKFIRFTDVPSIGTDVNDAATAARVYGQYNEGGFYVIYDVDGKVLEKAAHKLRAGQRVEIEFEQVGRNVHAREEERHLDRCGLRGVRAVHGVGVDAVGEVGTDGALLGLLRIGGTHQLAVLGDRALAFERLIRADLDAPAPAGDSPAAELAGLLDGAFLPDADPGWRVWMEAIEAA
eukprot:gene50968-62330_t